MSGVGEALAIVGCVAGLIQAYDAGTRIIKQIKARRKAHGAPPPWVELEESIEKGKREIESAVQDGTKRFGSDFIVGDTMAQLALYQITITTQNALLECLALARYDDEYNDFDECIDSSDKGRIDALVALREQYQRRWDEHKVRRELEAMKQIEAQKESTRLQPVIEKPVERQPISENSSRNKTCNPIPQPAPEPQKRRTSSFFRSGRKESQSFARNSSSEANVSRPLNPPPLQRSSTNMSDTGSLPSRHKAPSIDSKFSGDTNYSPAESPAPSSPMISRSSTAISQAPTLVPITKYGGACKYAHMTREGGLKKGLELHNIAFQTVQLTYQCRSVKCKFRIPYDNEAQKIDNRVRACCGVEYRPAFLAKSHVALDKVVSHNHHPFLCLICMMLKNDSQVYHGREELFSHIVGHKERTLGDTPLEGPLIFSNDRVVPGVDFDINIPDFESPPLTPVSLPVKSVEINAGAELDKLLEAMQDPITVSHRPPRPDKVMIVLDPNSVEHNPWLA